MSPWTSATRRKLYAGRRPHRLASLLNRGQATLHSAGIWPKRLATLEVRGRRSGLAPSVASSHHLSRRDRSGRNRFAHTLLLSIRKRASRRMASGRE
jgi:hypothetical protein